MGAFIKILPWIAIYAFIGVVAGCAIYTWSKDDDRYIKAKNCTCDKFRRNRFWRYKVKG